MVHFLTHSFIWIGKVWYQYKWWTNSKGLFSNDEECASTTTIQAQEKVLWSFSTTFGEENISYQINDRWIVEWPCGILEESKKDGTFCLKAKLLPHTCYFDTCLTCILFWYRTHVRRIKRTDPKLNSIIQPALVATWFM